LTPKARLLAIAVEIVADPVAQVVDGNVIPARTVRVEVEAEGRTTTTGLRDVPSDQARGTVVFTSLDGRATSIPQGTGVRTTSGTQVRFRTTQTVAIEPRIGATVEAPIAAVEPGPAGNVRAQIINAIDGPLGLQLAVVNPAPTSGGASAPRPAVTEADRERLMEELSARLLADGLTAIQGQVAPGEFLANESVRVEAVVAETYDLPAGEQADTVGLTLRLAVSGLAVSEGDARSVAQGTLAAVVAAGETFLPGQERYVRERTSSIDEDGRAHFVIQAEGAAVPVINRETIREAIRGRPLDEAALTLTGLLPLSRVPRVDVSPLWMSRLPWMPFRIEVVVLAGELA
jgi:hypothetical protein